MHFYGYLGNSPDAIQLQYLIKVEYWTPEYQHLNKRASFAWTRNVLVRILLNVIIAFPEF